MHHMNPGRLQYAFEKALGLDVSKYSEKPKAPDIPDALLYDLVRPLAPLKYQSEVNYLVAPISGPLKTLQVLELEYSPADWHAVDLAFVWEGDVLERITPVYQLTLGAGETWVHAAHIAVHHYPNQDFTGGRALYLFGWKPEKDSPISAILIGGADRVFGGEITPIGSFGETDAGDAGAWRPLTAFDFWYEITPHFMVGMENDFFFDSKHEEYVVLPHVNWQPIEHLRLQLGAGYYRLGEDEEALLAFRVDLFNHSPRVARGD